MVYHVDRQAKEGISQKERQKAKEIRSEIRKTKENSNSQFPNKFQIKTKIPSPKRAIVLLLTLRSLRLKLEMADG